MAKNKIIFGGEVLIDLTGDTVSPETLANGVTAHDKSGELITGTSTKDSDTSDATAKVAEILTGKTAYVAGQKITGTMPNRSATSGADNATISTKAQQVAITQGYHDGAGKVQISSTEQAKIIASNIKTGISILGVTGTYGGESIKAGPASFTPTKNGGTVLPTSGNDYITQVTVAAIPYVETENASGGITVTIA